MGQFFYGKILIIFTLKMIKIFFFFKLNALLCPPRLKLLLGTFLYKYYRTMCDKLFIA